MFARLCVGVAGLVFVLLAATTASLAESPTPTPTAETSIATPTPVVTPVGCLGPTPEPGMSPTPATTDGPAAPSDLRAELVTDPELASGSAVQLTWQDNADNETCFLVLVWMDGELIRTVGPFFPVDGSTTGPMAWEEIPDRTGSICYQVDFGNSVGQAYSNQACVDVEVLPVWKTATPTPPTMETPMPSPPTCNSEGPIGSPGAPNPPTNLRAELVKDSTVLEGAVRLEWYDNADNDTCYFLERKVDGGEWLRQWASYPFGPEYTGLVPASDIPGQLGVHCYRIFYANGAGRSAYSDEVCVDVEVVPNVLVPTPPPWPCHPRDDPPYSELAPSPPTDLTATLVADPTVSGGLSVRLVWQHFSADELCYRAQRLELDGTWQWFATGSGSAEVDSQPLPGARCYRVAAANEHGRSDWSNEACATGEPITPTPAATGPAIAVPRALPITGGGHEGAALGWWWMLAAIASALVAVAALSLVTAARRRRRALR